MRKMKKFLALGLAAAMTLSMAACGNSSDSVANNTPAESTPAAPAESTPADTTPADAETPADTDADAPAANAGDWDGSYEECELTFSWWGGDSRHEATMAAVDAFEAKYPGITVKETYGAWSGWEESMATMFATKTAPDVNQINWNWITSYSSDGSAFLDLNTVSNVLDLTQFDQKYLDMCTVAGKLQAIPVSMTGRIFYWDKTTFDEAGIDTPKTLADLMAAGETFKTTLGDDYYPVALGEYDRMILMVYYLESVYGKNWVENGALNYTVEEIQEGLDFIQSLEDAHVTPSIATIAGDGAESLDKNPKWAEGQYAGIFEWDSSASKFGGALADGREFVVGEELSDMGNYQGGFTKVSLGFAISEGTAHPTEAAMLMQFLLNDDEGTTIMASERGIPLSKAALANCTAQGLLNETVAEANGKILDYVSYELDPKFEDAGLKNSDGVYYDAMAGLSYGDYDSAAAAQVIFDGVTEVLNK